jgi:hypothetical protein
MVADGAWQSPRRGLPAGRRVNRHHVGIILTQGRAARSVLRHSVVPVGLAPIITTVDFSERCRAPRLKTNTEAKSQRAIFQQYLIRYPKTASQPSAFSDGNRSVTSQMKAGDSGARRCAARDSGRDASGRTVCE